MNARERVKQALSCRKPDCMDAVAIKREFGDKLALWGTVNRERR